MRRTERPLRVDRFVLSPGDDDVLLHFLDRLFVAHSVRERLRGLAARQSLSLRLPGAARRLLAESDSSSRDAGTDHAERAFRRAGVDPGGRWIQVLDYPGAGRGGSVVFAFPPGGREPSTVAKVRPFEASAAPLLREKDALAHVRRRLTPELRPTVPEPRSYAVEDGLEILTLSFLPGRPVYLDLCNPLIPGRGADRHMAAAARWLVGFHEATAEPGAALEPDRDLPSPAPLRETLRQYLGPTAGDRELELGWYRRLRDELLRRPPARTGVHGDFWARNLLLGAGSSPAVVDWEHAHSHGSPSCDLFHFPLTYASNHPWARYRGLHPLEVFRRTFLARTRLSRAVRDYLVFYAKRRGIGLDLLRPLFLLHLLTKGAGCAGGTAEGTGFGRGVDGVAGSVEKPDEAAGPDPEEGFRIAAYAVMRRARESVFSP